jgi:hypothetical protein
MIDVNVTFDGSNIIVNGFTIYFRCDNEWIIEGVDRYFFDIEDAVNYCLEYSG